MGHGGHLAFERDNAANSLLGTRLRGDGNRLGLFVPLY